ncbi:MAG: GFA family protein [Pseudomonadota bacterium]
MSLENPVYADAIEGRCLCGAVRMCVGRHRAEVGACHCARCRRWTGVAYNAFSAEPDQVIIEGEVAIYAGKIAERAFCPRCGTSLWLRNPGEEYEFMVGAFEDARDYPLISEIYIDRAFASCRLAGDHRRKTQAEYEAANQHTAELD